MAESESADHSKIDIKPQERSCPYCHKSWVPRVSDPKFCPYCKRPLVKVSSKSILKETEGVDHTPDKVILCDLCPRPALFKHEGKNYCKYCYVKALEDVEQPESTSDLLKSMLEH